MSSSLRNRALIASRDGTPRNLNLWEGPLEQTMNLLVVCREALQLVGESSWPRVVENDALVASLRRYRVPKLTDDTLITFPVFIDLLRLQKPWQSRTWFCVKSGAFYSLSDIELLYADRGSRGLSFFTHPQLPGITAKHIAPFLW